MAVCFATPLFFSGNISLHSLKLVLLVLSSEAGWEPGLFLAQDGAGLSAGPGPTGNNSTPLLSQVSTQKSSSL